MDLFCFFSLNVQNGGIDADKPSITFLFFDRIQNVCEQLKYQTTNAISHFMWLFLIKCVPFWIYFEQNNINSCATTSQ